jgi:alanine racemase
VIRHRPTVAVVDLDALRHNLRVLSPRSAEVMAVVKANAYGHGSVPVARAALEAGARWLGVALVEEGIELREAGITARILVLAEFPPGSEKDALVGGLTPTVYTEDGLRRLVEAAGAVGRRVGVHVKVDTGMHRVGVEEERALGFVRDVVDSGLELEGLWTHFAMAEERDHPFTRGQLDRFTAMVDALGREGIAPPYRHVANSAASILHPDTHLDMVRLGIAMYGLSPGPQVDTGMLRPVMSVKSAVSLVKRVRGGEAVSYGRRYHLERASTIVTVPVGYADGYGRALSNRAHVIIRGRRHPVAGTVTMDHIMVDCGDDPVETGDEVVLIGRHAEAEISADEVADWAGTIGYEVVCGIGPRVPRIYVEAG